MKTKENFIKADLLGGDFSDNTMTFEVEGDMILKAGKYIILTEKEYENLFSVDKKSLHKDESLIGNMCLTFRHDFGLLSLLMQDHLREDCKNWLMAYDAQL